jgi:3-hydroxyisobutyrate dehydrogenase-like beta-hydroxyacid dehydrogenase
MDAERGSEAGDRGQDRRQHGCRVYRLYTAKIVDGDFGAGFTMNLRLKDLGLAAAAAEHTRHSLPLLGAVRARMAEAVTSGLGDKDWSAIAGYTLHS